jgi:raffinose/stachyose/melibiose transport system substrate-binding protein
MNIERRMVVGGLPMLVLAARARAADPKKVTWWFGRADSNAQAAMQRDIVEAFNASQDRYALSLEVRGADIDKFLRVALVAGSGPDIVSTSGPTYLVPIAAAGQLKPLEDEAQRFGWTEKFLPALLDTCRYKGKLYAIPRDYETMFLFYNQKLFAEHGWKLPTNRAEFESLAADMMDKGIVPICNGNADWQGVNEWLMSVFFNSVSGPTNVGAALRGELPWTAPPFVDAVELTRDWYKKGWFGKNYLSLTTEQAFLQLASGKAGMSLSGSWAFGFKNFGLSSSDTPLDVAGMPGLSHDVTAPVYALGCGAAMSINKNSAQPDGAAEVLNFLLSDQFFNTINRDWPGKWTLPLKSVTQAKLDALGYPMFAKAMGDLTQAVEAGKYGYATWTFWPPATQQYLIQGIEQVWLDRITSLAYLQRMDSTFQQELKQGKVPPVPGQG